MEVLNINGFDIEKREIDIIVNQIINILSKKNITYAIAYMILNEVKNSLENKIIT